MGSVCCIHSAIKKLHISEDNGEKGFKKFKVKQMPLKTMDLQIINYKICKSLAS